MERSDCCGGNMHRSGVSVCRGGSALATNYTFYMFCTANNKSEI